MASPDMASIEKKNFAAFTETRTFDKTRIDIVHLGTTKIIRFTLEPGWR